MEMTYVFMVQHIASHRRAVVVLAVVTYLFDSLRENRSVPLIKKAGVAGFKNSCGAPVENC